MTLRCFAWLLAAATAFAAIGYSAQAPTPSSVVTADNIPTTAKWFIPLTWRDLAEEPYGRHVRMRSPGPVVTTDDITETAAWFNSLTWPDLTGKPYVEIAFSKQHTPHIKTDGPTVRGFLLGEDEQSLTVFSDGTNPHRVGMRDLSWPFLAVRITKPDPATVVDSPMVCRPLELSAAVDEVITELRRPKDIIELAESHSGQKTSDRTGVFALARCCARQGRSDLAEQLDHELSTLRLKPQMGRRYADLSFRTGVETEIATVVMWKAAVDVGDLTVSRPELLKEFERVASDFPHTEHHAPAQQLAEAFRAMIAEDEAHARTTKPLDAMTDAEKVSEFIFRLRDQNGHQWCQPGSCDIFQEEALSERGTTTAHQLVKLGPAAVPALIDALSDGRPTRSVGFWRDFVFSHHVLTVGDCAERILSRIAGRTFWTGYGPGEGAGAMTKDERIKETRREVEGWWHGA